MKKLFFYILTSISFINSYSQLSTDDEIITNNITDPEWETTDFSPIFHKGGNVTNGITSYKGATYFVYMDSLRRPIMGKISKEGIKTTSRLDKNDVDPYYVAPDGHNKFTIGIDKNGYIHVLGDMHQYGAETTIPYVDRYKGIAYIKDHHSLDRGLTVKADGSHILYWVSENAEDINSFNFTGNDLEKKIPGNGFSYPSFHNDMNGKLYARLRSRVSGAGHYDGEMGWTLVKYDEKNQTWSQLGGKSPSNSYPHPDYETLHKSIFWEDNGISALFHDNPKGRQWYQGFNGSMNFDFNNRLHACAAIHNDNSAITMTDIIYAYSDDEGMSFNRADGTSVSKLPVRVDIGPNQGSIVSDLSDSPNGYNIYASVGADKEGSPVVNYTKLNELGNYRYWDKDNNTWSAEEQYPASSHNGQITVLDANGIVTYIGTGANIFITRDFGLTSYGNDIERTLIDGSFFSIDKKGIREENVIRGFYYDSDEATPTLKIVKIQGTPKSFTPIADEWTTDPIGKVTISDTANMYHDIYQLRSSGTFNDDENFSGQYVNQTIKGDFELQARVINVNYVEDDSFAGLMVRDNNDDNSSFFGIAVTSYEGVKTISNDGTSMKTVIAEEYEPSEWLKIRKTGHLLESFRSDNGKDWTEVGRRAIGMTKTVSLGLISGSGNSTEKGHSRIDHVSIKNLNLIAHYEFNNNLLDVSGNNLNGTNNQGIPNFKTDGKNQSLNLGETNGYVTVRTDELLTPNTFTVSTWIKPNNLNDTEGIIRSANADGSSSGWRLIMNEGNIVARVTTDEKSGVAQINGIVANEWNHVAFTYDNNNITAYLNGVFSSSSSLSGSVLYPKKLIMEIGHSSGVDTFEGQIDEMKIYNLALNRSSILRNYQTEQNYFLSSISSKSLTNSVVQGVDNAEQDNIIITLYPNPANGAINIMYPDFSGNEEVQIIDTTGRTLISKKLEGANSIIDISNLESSIYFVKISTPNGKVNVRKIVVE